MFTPSEAAGMGAAGAIIISVERGRMGWRRLFGCLLERIQVTARLADPRRRDPVRLHLTIVQMPQKNTHLLLGMELGPYPTLLLILLFMMRSSS